MPLKKSGTQRASIETLQPLRERNLDRGLRAFDPITFPLEIGIFKDQYAANGHENVAQRCLSQALTLRSLNENLSPWLRIDLYLNVKRHHRSGGFVCIDDVRRSL